MEFTLTLSRFFNQSGLHVRLFFGGQPRDHAFSSLEILTTSRI